jgi:hypothetical protein
VDGFWTAKSVKIDPIIAVGPSESCRRHAHQTGC